MKILLYTEMEKKVAKSGLGKAIKHQEQALTYAGVEYTRNSKDDYDILHINTYFPKSYLFARKAKKNGKKIVYHAHSTEEDFKNSFPFSNTISPLFKRWIIRAYKSGDVIITPTPYSKKILDGYGINKKIYAISNGLDTSKFKYNEDLGREFRKKYGYKKDDKVIIGIGLYLERKGIIDFVELAKRLPEYEFIWFGFLNLSATTRNVRKAVKTKLPNLKFAGYVPSEEIMGAMSGADLYLFPTLEETEGIPIIEACAVGVNALIRDIPIFEGMLEDGVNVYKAKDLNEFEIKIKKILNKELPSVARNAKKIAEERDIRNVGKQLKEVYESLYR